MAIVIGVVVGLVLLLALTYILIRNGIIGSRNRVDEAWSGIDVQLKRRHDLIPNLVESVKGYATHEQQTFQKTTEARAAAMQAASSSGGAENVAKVQAAESALSGALAELRAVAENYPQLRATENFQQLSNNLSEIEDEIQASRRIYNSNVQAYNTKIQIFPNSIVANQGGFSAREFFEISDAGDREVPEISFSGTPGAGAPPAAEAPPAS